MILEIMQKTQASARRICHALSLPRSSFYAAATTTPTQREDQRLGLMIESVFRLHRCRYGYRRIGAQLRAQGETCAPSRVRRLMRERHLHALQSKHFVPKTSDGRADRPSPNLLEEKALPTAPNRVWTSDITYIPGEHGWLYLAVIMDLYSRKIVGWSLDKHMKADLVLRAMRQALASRSVPAGLIFHSDRGSQYSSKAFRGLLEKHELRQSMSAKANPYDNAWTESFFGGLKREMLQNGCFMDATDAQIELHEHIEIYYNRQRLHSSLNYRSPASFEAQNPSLN